MPVYRVIAGGAGRGVELFFEAPNEASVRELVTRRGLSILEVNTLEALPDGASVQRLSPPRPSLRDRDPMLHRIRLMALGILIGLVIALGVVFVDRARHHLTRSDIYPTTQAGEAAPPGASPSGTTPASP
jgi:hypothetical protein